MQVLNSLINAAAVWFVLKAVEVIPLAIYDVFVLIKRRFTIQEQEEDTTELAPLNNQYDSNRGKLEYILNGNGFFQFSSIRRSKKWFIFASLVPLLVFVLEIMSIFLGNETRICESSSNPDIVKASSLQLFTEGPREITVMELKGEINKTGRTLRPCYFKESSFSGVEYLASVCSDFARIPVSMSLGRERSSANLNFSVGIPKQQLNTSSLLLAIFSRPSKPPFENATRLGILDIYSEVLVNGKRMLSNDVLNDSFTETRIEEVRSDVRTLEEAGNYTAGEFMENSKWFFFEWAGFRDFNFGARNVILALISQSRSTGLRTASEMSSRNISVPETDIACRVDYTLPRRVSIAIIVIAVFLRLLLEAVPKSRSSAEYALRISEGDKWNGTSSASVWDNGERRPYQSS